MRHLQIPSVRRLRLSALDRKLVRDLWAMRGQALAIAAVVAAGVTMFVTYLSNFDSLQRTRADYYQRQRFGDVFASLTRAPRSLADRLAQVPGAAVVSTRVVADVTLDVPGLDEPASGRVIEVPELGEPALNAVYVRRGRWIEPGRSDEVLANEVFCEANGLQPGDRVAAIINGRKRWLTIVGIGLSPEYIYAVKPGEMIADRRRYGILWMGRQGLSAALDMQGAFNDVSLTPAPGASEQAAVTALDRWLQPYGGRGAVPRRLQMSAWTLENELAQLQTFGFIVPAIFLGVAAFILNVALTRALALQRPEIAALKALGYANREIAWHYIKWGLLIAAVGSLVGVAVGAWLGSGLITLYNRYFRFPALDYRLSTDVAAQAVAISLVTAALGAQSAVRRAVRIPPAQAMRPESPHRYRVSLAESLWRGRLSHAARMVLRNVERQPTRALLSVVGISLAVAVLLVGLSFLDVMDRLITHQFTQTMRQDATLTFSGPRSGRVAHDVAHLPGVLDVETARALAVRLRVGPRTRTTALTGVDARPRLNRVTDRYGSAVEIPPEGLVLSDMLAAILGVARGDVVGVEVLEGHRPVFELPIAATVDDALGLQAYMHVDALRRLMREGPTVTTAHVSVDPAAREVFYREVKRMPAVAGVALLDVTLQNFRATMAESMNLQIAFNVGFAAIIALGVVYNAARVSLSERARELASLRVLGFTRAEISSLLLGELALLTVAALPLGIALGQVLGHAIMLGFNNEVYRLSFSVSAATTAWVCLTILAAATLSGLLVRRTLDGLDLVAVLKSRE